MIKIGDKVQLKRHRDEMKIPYTYKVLDVHNNQVTKVILISSSKHLATAQDCNLDFNLWVVVDYANLTPKQLVCRRAMEMESRLKIKRAYV